MTEWWRGLNTIKPSTAQFTVDVLKREMQLVSICQLCGLTVERGEAAFHDPNSRGIIHAQCPPEAIV